LRDRYRRRLRASLWGAVAVGIAVSLSPKVGAPLVPAAQPAAPAEAGRAALAAPDQAAASAALIQAAASRPGGPANSRKVTAADIAAVLGPGGKNLTGRHGNAVTQARTVIQYLGQTEASAAQEAGVFLPSRTYSAGGQAGPAGRPGRNGHAAGTTGGAAVPVAKRTRLAGLTSGPRVGRLRDLRPADLFVVAPRMLPVSALDAIRRLPGVTAAEALDAARLKVNGGDVAVLGVSPAAFREFAAKPTARATGLWQNVADGAIAVSYLMGKQEKLPLGGTVKVTGGHTEKLVVGGYGTVGISGVDAVVSESVARSLGMPSGNAIVISAPKARLTDLMRKVKAVIPADASVAPLVTQAPERGLPATAGYAGAIGVTSSGGPGLTVAQTETFLTAALSRVGHRYVWGGNGPEVFDCSGLVQWSMRQAGIVMPRVAVNQAQAGPRVPLADLEPGDLLFYHTDPTAPTYISHVAIYLGHGLMLQAPEPGMDVQIVPAIFGSGFAGAVRVYPGIAAAVAAVTG
jgi:cell wall-associated NlpC family hydrolase